MSHPELDRLTAWVHGLLEPEDRRAVEDHAADCGACRETADRLREEARAVAREVAPPDRLAALKDRILRVAGGAVPLPAHRPGRGYLWQLPLAAAVLAGLVALFLFPRARHDLMAGRVMIENGGEVTAPADLAASRTWRLQAVEKTRIRLADRSIVDLAPGSWIGLSPGGERGVQAELVSGEIAFEVVQDPKRLSVCSPVGHVQASGGRFAIKAVYQDEGGTPMKGTLAGAIVTVFAGSIALSNANGATEAAPGQVAVLARSEAPLYTVSPQDAQEGLLRRLEELAVRVAKLEAEIAQLEARNKQLKTLLSQGWAGRAYAGGAWSGGPGGVKVLPGQSLDPNAPGASVIIIEEGDRKTNPAEKKER